MSLLPSAVFLLDHGDSASPAASLELIAASSLGFLVLIAVSWYAVKRYVLT